jgi:single-strand DNA-binding protein
MASLNRAQIIGNLGQDVEVRYTEKGMAVCTLSVASNERWTDKATGEIQERTEWHRVVVWGKQAENCGKYLAKGRPVYAEGTLRTREFTDKEGHKRYTTEIHALSVQFLGAAPRAGEAPPPSDDDAPPPRTGNDNDIPL